MTCCGVKEASGLPTYPEYFILDIIKDRNKGSTVPFYMFTYPTHGQSGRKVADYIRENKLGSLMESNVSRNPNSGNDLQGWIFAPDSAALDAIKIKIDEEISNRSSKVKGFKVGDVVYWNQNQQFSEIKLGDCGVVVSIDRALTPTIKFEVYAYPIPCSETYIQKEKVGKIEQFVANLRENF